MPLQFYHIRKMPLLFTKSAKCHWNFVKLDPCHRCRIFHPSPSLQCGTHTSAPSSSSIPSLLPSPSLSGKQQQHVVGEQQQQVAGSNIDQPPTPFTVVYTKHSCSAALCPTPKIKSHRRQEIQVQSLICFDDLQSHGCSLLIVRSLPLLFELAHDDDSHHGDDDHDDDEGGAARKKQLLRRRRRGRRPAGGGHHAGKPAVDGLHHGPALERHRGGGSRHKLRRGGGGDGLATIAGLGIPRRRLWPLPPSSAGCCRCRRRPPAAVVCRRETGKGEERGWRKRVELTCGSHTGVTAMDGKCDGGGMDPILQSSSGTQQISQIVPAIF
uniref:Uncharacterized protein n=1 Tax=Oryza glumipatula TaxID=40148 RepID=A0A0E0API6_9ORYZ